MTQNKSTLIGTIAIIMWSTLAIFTVLSGNIPPLELLSISFSVAFCIGVLLWLKKEKASFKYLKQPFLVWFVGIGGLFGYHFFYFLAIKNAPVLQANLINYLWPLFIVLFSSFLPNEKLRPNHVLGAFLGFFGACILMFGENVLHTLFFEFHSGYIYAFLCAITWSSYSVISRTFSHVPTSVVGAFCGVVAILSWSAHLVFEKTIMPSYIELFAALMLGLGPVGGAFYVWDIGMKKGDIKLLGSLCYFVPLVSTLLLIFFDLANNSINVWIACGFIILGSLISSKNYLSKKQNST